jgi:uncharacterized protein
MEAIRDIKKGEEITYDYATSETLNNWKMECKCGSKNCRKIISGEDYKKEDVIKKFNGHFMSYLQKLVDDYVKKNGIKL